MQLEDYFEFIGSEVQSPESSRAIRIKGHRIGIEHVLSYYREGYTPDEIATEFPGLNLEKIYATITYYLHNQTRVNAYITRLKTRNEREYATWAKTSPPIVQRLREAQAQYTIESQE